MAERKRWEVLRPVAMGAAALALSGCAATHVGEHWQCPLAQGEVCTSVADADPAVPETRVPEAREAGPLAWNAPLYRPRDAEDGAAAGAAAAHAEAGCAPGCGPLAWLGRLFERLAGGDAALAGAPEDGGAAAGPSSSRPVAAHGARGVSGPAPDPAGAADGAGAPLPPHAGADGGGGAPATAAGIASAIPPDDGLREPEVLGRVWIAPFVDAHGIYREGAWVRLVIEPARWRMP